MDELGWQGCVGFVEGRELAAAVGDHSEDLGVLYCGFFDVEVYSGEICW